VGRFLLHFLIVSLDGLLLFSLLFSSGIQEVGELLVRSLVQFGFLPQIRGQVGIGIVEGSEGSLYEVSKCLCASLGLSEHILNSSILKDLLWCSGCYDTSTSWSRYKSYTNGSTLSSDLGWDSVRSTDLVTPISSSHRYNGELGRDDSTTNSSGNFLCAFHTKTNVSVVITNDNKGLESGSLTSTSLLLNRHDLHNFILQLAAKEPVNDLIFLNGQGVEIDLF